MKKLLSVLLCFMLILGLAACKSKSDSDPTSSAEPIPAVGGIITDASMNTVTLETGDKILYTFSTEDADKSQSKGLETGSAVWVY